MKDLIKLGAVILYMRFALPAATILAIYLFLKDIITWNFQ